jgi:predicted HAD superfamily Cof-like phosphohydrolase
MKTVFRTLSDAEILSLAARYDADEDVQHALAEMMHLRRGSICSQVTAFHRMIGSPVLNTPQVPEDDRVMLRGRLVIEEAFEFLAAICPSVDWRRWGEDAILTLRNAPISVDLPEAADALADLDYVSEGSRLEFGIDGAPIATEVHRSNMLKADGPVDEHGKKRKPPGWTPPDIAGELRKQGWRG